VRLQFLWAVLNANCFFGRSAATCLSFILLYLFFGQISHAYDRQYRDALGRCEPNLVHNAVKVGPAERKEACNIIIRAGTTPGGTTDIDGITRGELWYVDGLTSRAQANLDLKLYGAAITDYNHAIDFLQS
jgi:hypothetical protein